MKLLLPAIFLAGCIFEPEKKSDRIIEVDSNCIHEDSTTWIDTTEIRHYSCKIGGEIKQADP